MGALPTPPGYARYTPPNPREDGGPRCSVSHLDAGGPCGAGAVMEVWALPFCPAHGREADAAALAEMHEDAHDAAREALDAARPLWQTNAAVLEVFRAAEREAADSAQGHTPAHEDAAREVYGDAPDSATDPETLSYNGDEFAGGPVEWWGETRRAIVRAMREAHEAALPSLVWDLERLRERYTVQEILAVRRELSTSPA